MLSRIQKQTWPIIVWDVIGAVQLNWCDRIVFVQERRRIYALPQETAADFVDVAEGIIETSGRPARSQSG